MKEGYTPVFKITNDDKVTFVKPRKFIEDSNVYSNPNDSDWSYRPSLTVFYVKNSDLQKSVTRTIHITEPGKPTVTTTQTGSIKRTATLNDKDDKVQFSAWTPDGNNVWEAKTVPTVAGYTTVIEQLETNEDGTVTRNTLTSIPEVTVDGSTLPTTINGTYTANPQSVLINFVDDDNLFEGEPKVVKSDTIDGVTGQNISLNLSVLEHYVLAENQTLPTDYTFTVAKNQSITIHLKEKVDQVTDPVQLNKTIIRKITINKPGGGPNSY